MKIDWKRVKPEVVVISLALLCLGAFSVFIAVGQFYGLLECAQQPKCNFYQKSFWVDQPWGKWLAIGPVLSFLGLKSILKNNEVSEFKLGIILSFLCLMILFMLSATLHNPAFRLSIFPIMLLSCGYASGKLYKVAKHTPKIKNLEQQDQFTVSWIVIFVNCWFLFVSLVVSGATRYL